MPRGRPAKKPTHEEALLEGAISERIAVDTGAPGIDEVTRRYRMRRLERRQLSQAQREDWAIDAFRAFVDHLENGLTTDEPVRTLPHRDLPPQIEKYPVRRRRSLLPEHVASWAYRHIVLRETYRSIAESLVPEPRSPKRQQALDAQYHAAMQSPDERTRRYAEAHRVITAPYRTDFEPHDTDSIRKAVGADRIIWEVAQATFHAR